MKKFISRTTSYNSGTSSETSETQSVEENQTYNSQSSLHSVGSKIPKSRIRMRDGNSDKEIDSKRPPWRAVSVSTLPKPDKNAILKAKLLDASRRLRASKVTVGVQTDTDNAIMMKDVAVGAQTDLILFKEMGILTDGIYTKCRDGDQEYVLTYSVALTTDTVDVAEVATQTLLPKVSGDAFLEAYLTNKPKYNSDLLKYCTNIQQKLLQQLSRLRANLKSQDSKHVVKSTSSSSSSSSSGSSKEYKLLNDINSMDNNNNNNDVDADVNDDEDIIKYQQRPSLLQRTDRCWRFEDFRIDDQQVRPYIIQAKKPWNSFVPFSFYKYQHYDWNLLLIAIDELINESNHLVDVIENKLKQRKQQQRNFQHETLSAKLDEFVPIDLKLPSEYWLPIIEQQEKQLAELNDFKPINIEIYEKFLREC